MSDRVTAARDAVRRHDWADAVTAFHDAELERDLGPEDLVAMAGAAWWSGDVDEAVGALERAYGAFVEAGRNADAAVAALRLAEMAARRVNFAVAGGWLARAERLLADEPEGPAHALLLFMLAVVALQQRSDVDRALELTERSIEVARGHGAAGVESMALAVKGQALLRGGRWSEAMAALDEAAATAGSGGLDPKDACNVFCLTISACSDVGDYRRAGEWVSEADRWMQQRELPAYPGVCRVHRAELQRLRGAWREAEHEARGAFDELQRFGILDVLGFAHNEVGEVRLRMGDLPAAEEAFERAYEYGYTPQPGLALLQLARGELEQARRSIARALSTEDEPPLAANPLRRSRLLPAQVEIALAAGDVATARKAAEELDTVAATYESEALKAAALTSHGAVALQEGAVDDATATLDRAWRAWQKLDLPYEGARARVLLGRARAEAGDDGLARLEYKAARSTFERLGAKRDLGQVGALLDRVEVDHRAETKTFMFTDIVTSTDLVRLIGDAAWQELIAWHDRVLNDAFREHGGEVVRHTGDGFFVSFERAADALRCAVAIQRELARHRHEHGFAPWVRIGVHTAEASRHGGDWAGHGVHVAARVGALAEREEILVSREALEDAGPLDVPAGEPRSVTLKGVDGPVEVLALQWA